jgi:glycosyltransferase involved in cell wall biosynthesis
MMNSNLLILLTSSFPYGNGEPYLHTEMKFLINSFDEIYIVPTNKEGELSMSLPSHVHIVHIVESSVNIKLKDKYFLFSTILSELLHWVRLPNKAHQLKYYSAYLKHKQKIAVMLAQEINMEALVRENKVYVYSYWYNELAIIAGFFKHQYPNIKTISRAHGFDVFEEQNKYGYIPFKKFKIKYLDAIYSVSQKGKQHLQAQFNDNEIKMHCSYLGTISAAPQLSSSKNNRFSIATCSFIHSIKRLNLLMDVLTHCTSNIIWHVIGNGPNLEQLKKKSETLPKHIQVVFHGYLTQQELYHFYQHNFINLFCSVSTSEGLPVSMMEAISFGIPLMSTDVGGCHEICNEQTGFLIPKDFDFKKVASQIEAFRNSSKNTIDFRHEVLQFWEQNFNATVNYTNFVSKILLND